MQKKLHSLSGVVAGMLLAVSCSQPPVATPTAAEIPSPSLSPEPTFTVTAAKTAVTLYPVATPTAIPSPVPGTLYVKADLSLGKISPFIYGANYGPWENLTRTTLPAIQEAGIRFLRYPGGAFGDENMFSESAFDDFIELARTLGAEPMVNIKLRNSTPKTAAGTVKYANITKQYGVRYWAIGNEPNLYPQEYNMRNYDTEAFNAQWREFALAMKAEDPSIQLLGPETNQFTGESSVDPKDRYGRDWLKEFLWANGDLVDVVSIHRYPFGTYDTNITDLKKNTKEWDIIVPNLRNIIQNQLGRNLPVAVTEYNSNYTNKAGDEATPDSFYNAIWLADVLGRMGRQQIFQAAYFCLEGAGGLGLTGISDIRPSLYIFTLYQRFGSEALYASSDVPFLNMYAAKTGDGKLTLMIVNMESQILSRTIQIDGGAFSPTAEVWRFDSTHNSEQISPIRVDGKTPIAFPAQSVTLLILPPSGS